VIVYTAHICHDLVYVCQFEFCDFRGSIACIMCKYLKLFGAIPEEGATKKAENIRINFNMMMMSNAAFIHAGLTTR